MWCAPCTLLLAVNVVCPMYIAAGQLMLCAPCTLLLAVNVVCPMYIAAGSQRGVPHVHCCWAVNVVRLCTAAGSQGVVPHVRMAVLLHHSQCPTKLSTNIGQWALLLVFTE